MRLESGLKGQIVLPRLAYLVALLLSAVTGYFLFHTPFQVGDNFTILLILQDSPSPARIFIEHLNTQGFLRPGRWATSKAIFDLAGFHQFAAYRAFTTLLITGCAVALVRLMRVRSTIAYGLAVVALFAMFGIHPFHEVIRESEVTIKLVATLVCLAMLVLSASRHHWWRDAAAIVLCAYIFMTTELGLLAWVCLAAGYIVGFRGVSGRAVAVATAMVGGYFYIRFFHLSAGLPGLAERSTGFGFEALGPAELTRRFANNRWPFYAYNVAASALSVLLSEPRGGVLVFTREVMESDVRIGSVVNVVTSLATTSIMVWYVMQRWRHWLRWSLTHEDRIFLVAAAIVGANAAISFPWAKDVTMSPAAAFYPLAAFASLSLLASSVTVETATMRRAIVVCGLLTIVSIGWTIRAASLGVDLRRAAYAAQSDWVGIDAFLDKEKITPSSARQRSLLNRFRADMIEMDVPKVYLEPSWVADIDPGH